MQKYIRPLQLTLVFAALLSVGVSASAQSAKYKRNKPAAKAADSKDQKGSKKYKVDISDVEKKYWSPKDTEFSVVQSRQYSKEKRISVSGLAGPMVNDPYSTGTNMAFSINYFMDERNGFEFHYSQVDLEDSDTVKAFLNDVGGGNGGVKPDHGKVESFYGVSYNWVPIYAKMSVLDKKIVYYDLAISPGLGMLTYEQQLQSGDKTESAIAYSLDVTQYFFLQKNLALRVDLRNKWFNEEVLQYSNAGSGNEGDKLRDDFTNTTSFLIGVTYYFD